MEKQSSRKQYTLPGLALTALSAVFLILVFPPSNPGFLIWVG